MTRVLSYNILLGGTHRIDQLEKMIHAAHPDIVGLVEATDPHVVEELATRLGMQYRLSGEGKRTRDWHVAVLSRLPILETKVHKRPDLFSRRHLLEVRIEGTDGKPLTVFVIHLASSVYRGERGNEIRRAEARALVEIMASHKGTPHLVMGDFNTLTPTDTMRSSVVVRYSLAQFEESLRKKRRLKWRHLTVLAAVRMFVFSPPGGFFINKIGPLYAQGGIDLLLDAGYIDCFRRKQEELHGFTFPASNPATRIDYIFASPELAGHLVSSGVVTAAEGIQGADASDHLPVWAEFVP